jgi:hypothetical protein
MDFLGIGVEQDTSGVKDVSGARSDHVGRKFLSVAQGHRGVFEQDVPDVPGFMHGGISGISMVSLFGVGNDHQGNRLGMPGKECKIDALVRSDGAAKGQWTARFFADMFFMLN